MILKLEFSFLYNQQRLFCNMEKRKTRLVWDLTVNILLTGDLIFLFLN
jgi:hypothetical protein